MDNYSVHQIHLFHFKDFGEMARDLEKSTSIVDLKINTNKSKVFRDSVVALMLRVDVAVNRLHIAKV